QAPAAAPGPAAAGATPRLVQPPEAGKKKDRNGSAEAVTALNEQTPPQIWEQVLRGAGPILASALKNAGPPANSGPNTLVIRFPSGYNQQRERCQEATQISRLEALLLKLTGRPWSVRVDAGNADTVASPAAPVEDSEASAARSRRQKAEALKLPLLER